MSFKISKQVSEIKLTYKNKVKAVDRPYVLSSQSAYWVLEANWSDQMSLVEEFNILLLDRSNRVLAMCPISKGGVSGTVVDLKIVFAAAIKGRASSIILGHNHPSGNLKPSLADIELTKKIKQAGEILDIGVLDHIILSPDGEYYSFSEECGL